MRGGGFSHEALLYRGHDDLVRHLVTFLRDGIASGEPALVVLPHPKLDAVRHALGDDADQVQFADMDRVGANPGRIIPAWRAFVDAHPGRRLRGVGEPINPQRLGAELRECHRHEALLNVALEDSDLWLLCPYDVTTLDTRVVDDACRTHPVLRSERGITASEHYTAVDRRLPFADALPEPVTTVVDVAFEGLPDVRAAVATAAIDAGLEAHRAGDLVIAVNEIATNSLRHGGGAGRLRIWSEEPWLVCEVRDTGLIAEPLAGRRQPMPDSEGGRGLWMANQLCDLVQLESSPAGTAVRLHVRA